MLDVSLEDSRHAPPPASIRFSWRLQGIEKGPLAYYRPNLMEETQTASYKEEPIGVLSEKEMPRASKLYLELLSVPRRRSLFKIASGTMGKRSLFPAQTSEFLKLNPFRGIGEERG